MKKISTTFFVMLLFAGFVSAKEITVRPNPDIPFFVYPGQGLLFGGFNVCCHEISVASSDGEKLCRLSLDKQIDYTFRRSRVESTWTLFLKKGDTLELLPGEKARVVDFSINQLVLECGEKSMFTEQVKPQSEDATPYLSLLLIPIGLVWAVILDHMLG
jgi:hypothetical protein